MLQQTRVTAVLPYFDRFMAALPTVAALADAPEQQLMLLWQGLGYYSRARNLQKAAQVIMTRHGGVFPDTYEGLTALPGVGDYTAGAIASIAFGQPVPAVDGNVLRLAARLTGCDDNVLEPENPRPLSPLDGGGDPVRPPRRVQSGADGSGRHGVPAQRSAPVRAVSRPDVLHRLRKGPAAATAGAGEENRPPGGAAHGVPAAAGGRDSAAAAARHGTAGRTVGVPQRPRRADGASGGGAAGEMGTVIPHRWGKSFTDKHVFTHITWEMTVFTITVQGAGPPEWVWCPDEEREKYPMPTAFGKLEKE